MVAWPGETEAQESWPVKELSGEGAGSACTSGGGSAP